MKPIKAGKEKKRNIHTQRNMKTETNKIKKNGNEKIKQTYTEMNQIYKIYIYIYIYINKYIHI